MSVRIVKIDFSSIIEDHWERSYAGACRIFRHYGVLEPSFKDYVQEISLVHNYCDYYKSYGINKPKNKIYERYEKWYLKYKTDIEVLSDVPEAFQSIGRAGIELKIISQAKYGFATALVESVHINDFLTGMEFHVKNKCDVFKETLTCRNISPKQCVMVGGTVQDVVYAKDVGMIAIAVLHNNISKELFENAQADYISTSWLDIAKYIIGLE